MIAELYSYRKSLRAISWSVSGLENEVDSSTKRTSLMASASTTTTFKRFAAVNIALLLQYRLCYTGIMLVIDPPQIKPLVPPLTPHNGMLRIGDTRVSLDSVIYAYRRGDSAEQIQDAYPTLFLPDIYTTIAWMLQNPADVDAYIVLREQDHAELRAETERMYPRDSAARERRLKRRQQFLSK